MSDRFGIRPAGLADGDVGALADVLIGCVEDGASVSFMLPLERAREEAFWAGMLASASRGERIVLVAEERDSAAVVGTVQVIRRRTPLPPARLATGRFDPRLCAVARWRPRRHEHPSTRNSRADPDRHWPLPGCRTCGAATRPGVHRTVGARALVIPAGG